jgi:DNA gyrase subunit B
MKELVEGGHVYIAVPPLYRLKIGRNERYVEKESQFEEILVRDRAQEVDVTDSAGSTFRVTETRYSRLVAALTEFDGWLARLRADFGNTVVSFVVDRHLVGLDANDPDAIERSLGELGDEGYDLEVVGRHNGSLRIRVTERETSAATHVELPIELLASPVYAGLRKTHRRLVELAGVPPFTLALGAKTADAANFQELRTGILDLAKAGIQVSRFKGLGEMNPSELWDTTMNPDNRVLVQVGVDDALLADRIFSTLMGDQVEPRREFIEQNAKYARLDV